MFLLMFKCQPHLASNHDDTVMVELHACEYIEASFAVNSTTLPKSLFGFCIDHVIHLIPQCWDGTILAEICMRSETVADPLLHYHLILLEC